MNHRLSKDKQGVDLPSADIKTNFGKYKTIELTF